MTAPAGKGIYARNPLIYPDDDPASYALAMGCDFVAFLDDKTDDETIVRATELGLSCYLWTGPEHWLSDNWVQALETQWERSLRLGIEGFIADPECAQAGSTACPVGWSGHVRRPVNLR